MKKLFKWILFLTVAPAVAGVVLLYNPGLAKGPLERYLSDVAGYPIHLEGELEINTGQLTVLTANNIHISGPDWADRKDLVTVSHLKLVLDTASLFKDTVIIDSLQVDKLQMNLETNADGIGNWIHANTEPSTSSGDNGDPVFVFNNVQINDTNLRYINGEKGLKHVLHIASLIQHQQSDGMLQITLDGDFNDSPVEFSGSIGPYANLLGGRNISYTGSGHFGSLNITGSGLIDGLLEPRRPRFSIEMQGPSIDEITTMLDIDDLGNDGFSLHARGDEVNDYYEAGIFGDIGDVSLDVTAKVSDLSQLDEIDLNLAINGPNLGSVTRAFGIENWPDKPFSLNGNVARVGSTLNISGLILNIGGTGLTLDALLTNFPNLDAGRIRLSISGNDVTQFRDLLGIPGVATGAFEVDGKLDVSPTGVELLQIELKTSLGQLTLSGTLGPAPGYIGSKLHMHLDGSNAHMLMSAFNIDALPEDPYSLDTRINIVDNGLIIERGVLVTIKEERLELGGFIAFNPDGKDTDIEARLSGQHLAQMLQRLVGDTRVPDLPYDLGGRIRIVEEGIQLENVQAEFAEMELAVTGLISLDDQLLGTALDFQLDGEDFSSLRNFEAIGGSLDIFIPGQSYQATGQFSINRNGWLLSDIKGRIGETTLNLDGLISNLPERAGSNLRFALNGPDLHQLLADQDASILPPGAFDTSGQVILSKDTLSIDDFKFDTVQVHGELDLELGWPISSSIDVSFSANVWGDDIRHLFPPAGSFEPEVAAYKIIAVGRKRGDLISVKQFSADIGNLQVSVKGQLDDDPGDENLDVSLSVISEDISALGRLNGNPLPAMALNFRADLKGNASQFVFQDIVGTLGENHIAGKLNVSLKGSKPTIKLTAKSNYIDIRPFLSQTASDDEADTAINRERLIPAIPLPLETLAAADVSIKLKIVELRHQHDSIKDLILVSELQAGSLSVPQLSFKGPRGKLRTALSINPTGNGKADVKIDLSAEKFILNLSGQPEDKLHQVPAIDMALHASGMGGNLQEVAGSVNGVFYLGTKGGILEGVNLSVLDTFVLDEIFGLIMPKSDKNNDLDLKCAATILKITDGLVETDPAFAFTTDKSMLISKGTIDLKTEKMKINFNATPNNALKISASELVNPYILVGGTLGKPVVGLDPAKVLVHGSVAIGTAGISILAKGLYDRVNNTTPLCQQMLVQVQQQQNL